MATMTDPTIGMLSFEQAIRNGEITTGRGELDSSLLVHFDRPAPGETRMTYARMEGDAVTAFVCFAQAEPYEGLPCFQAGWVVPERFRLQGRAVPIVEAAIAELKNGFGRTPVKAFYLEAVVGAENAASRRVAERTIAADGKEIVDHASGVPAIQYFQKVELGK